MRIVRISFYCWHVFRVRNGFEELAGEVKAPTKGGGCWAFLCSWETPGEPIVSGDPIPVEFATIREAAEALL
jgi:hypothetical protein